MCVCVCVRECVRACVRACVCTCVQQMLSTQLFLNIFDFCHMEEKVRQKAKIIFSIGKFQIELPEADLGRGESKRKNNVCLM